MNISRSFRLFVQIAISGTAFILLAGCAQRSAHYTSSVVQYLYPDKKEFVETPTVPVLSLPLRIGIAFVPETSRYAYVTRSLGEKEKMDLMRTISTAFKQYPFVKSIDIIPSAYLTPGGSFSNLDQIRTMYDVDVMVLLSYDQVQYTDEGLLSLSYWTLVGAYVVKGEKNDTSTMLDAAVYHIASRKMLFRAPGLSHIKGGATPVNLTEQLRADSQKGFQEAAAELITSLTEQLGLFEERVKESPKEYKIEHKAGYQGGGSLNLVTLSLAGVMGGALLWFDNRRKK